MAVLKITYKRTCIQINSDNLESGVHAGLSFHRGMGLTEELYKMALEAITPFSQAGLTKLNTLLPELRIFAHFLSQEDRVLFTQEVTS